MENYLYTMEIMMYIEKKKTNASYVCRKIMKHNKMKSND